MSSPTVFADTSFYIALLNRGDEWHTKALALASGSSARFVTTEWVLAELADAFAGSSARTRIKAFIDRLRLHPRVEIIGASSAQFEQGLVLYHNRSDKEWSLTDCISFEVMKDRKLTEAATGDHHFHQAGFNALFQ